jgi:hypothetical protein
VILAAFAILVSFWVNHYAMAWDLYFDKNDNTLFYNDTAANAVIVLSEYSSYWS